MSTFAEEVQIIKKRSISERQMKILKACWIGRRDASKLCETNLSAPNLATLSAVAEN